MKLSDRALDGLAEMVIGDNPAFPYRSSTWITRYFERCGFPFVHDGSTRKWWVKERLTELNLGSSHTQDLPSNDLLRVISELFDYEDFEKHNKRPEFADRQVSIEAARAVLNKLLAREGFVAYLDPTGRSYVRNMGTGINSSIVPGSPRPLTLDEIEQRKKLAEFLDSASEDEFTERVLVPFFQRLGFHRVSAAGHTEKALEYGKDLWMKYQLPTGHWLYFCAQIKRDKIDSAGASGGSNISTVLTQTRMAIDHPIFDPDANRKVLLDHIFLISAGTITRAARTWLVENLDAGQRRHIIFMDREEFLDHAGRILLDLRLENPLPADSDDVLPF
jgi:hypothetical protein